ncbi:MAG: iron ABC transporter substrate-binding protein [Alphaproteobacteria bacterium]|nr:iron ABC transporter substrate-binding protein [Alphaproteobacteria bacterium]
MRTTRRGALILLGAGVVASGARAQDRTVVDSAGRTITLPPRITKVFVAGPPASVLTYALARDAMVGWVRAPSPAEKEFLAPPARDLPEAGRLTGRGDTASLERVVGLKPDLILDFGSVSETYRSLADRVQSQTNIPYVLIDGRFDATVASIRLAADILGRKERGEALAQYAVTTLALVDRVVGKVPQDKRPQVYLARGPEGLETGGRGSINTEIIERVGAVNVAEGLNGRGGIFAASLEQILKWNPDTIITLDRGFHAAVQSKAGWSDVRAVAQKRVYLSPGLPWGWIDAPPSVNRLIGLRWLLAQFYPAEAGIDLPADTRAFYDLFYGVTLSDAQVARLLGGAPAR